MSRFSAPRRPVQMPHRSRGVAAVEFVITAPLLIFVMLATAEVGRAFVHYDTLSYSLRNSARFVTENALTGTSGVVGLSDAVVRQAQNLAVFGNVVGTGSRVLPNFQTTHVTVTGGGGLVQVAATYPYQPMIGSVLPTFGFTAGSIPLSFGMSIVVTMRAVS